MKVQFVSEREAHQAVWLIAALVWIYSVVSQSSDTRAISFAALLITTDALLLTAPIYVGWSHLGRIKWKARAVLFLAYCVIGLGMYRLASDELGDMVASLQSDAQVNELPLLQRAYFEALVPVVLGRGLLFMLPNSSKKMRTALALFAFSLLGIGVLSLFSGG